MSRVAASLVSDISKLSECLFPFLKNVHTQKVLIHYKQNHKELPSMPDQMINLSRLFNNCITTMRHLSACFLISQLSFCFYVYKRRKRRLAFNLFFELSRPNLLNRKVTFGICIIIITTSNL